MRLEVSAAGYASKWEFGGSGAFESWARTKPWLSRGGMCVIRSRSTGFAELFHSSLCAVLHAANADEKRLVVQRVETNGGTSSPMQGLLASIELDPMLNPFEARDLLGPRFLDRPRVFVLEVSSAIGGRGWQELAMLVEHFGKRVPVVPLCVVAFDGTGALQHDPAFDFSVGRCTHLLLEDAHRQNEGTTWRGYLHHRSCWESAGDPVKANALGEELSGCRLGNDEQVEEVLKAFAQDFASRIDLPGLIPVVRTAMDRSQRAAERDRARQLLTEHRLLWRPPGLQRLELTPWASRAALALRSIPPELTPRLRYNLVCTPVASEILAHCLGVEAKIRMQLFGRQSLPPDDKILSLFERYKSGGNEWVFYPGSHPSPPSTDADVWQFAGLGETLRSSSSVDRGSPLWNTVHLRNSIAHGHYVTWRHVRSALIQAQRFDV